MIKQIINIILIISIGVMIYHTLDDLEYRNIIIIVWSIIMSLLMVLDYILSRILKSLKELKKSLSNAKQQADKNNS